MARESIMGRTAKKENVPVFQKSEKRNIGIMSSSWSGPNDNFISSSLAGYLDKKLVLLLRDGREFFGILRSFDQFANIVLERACERIIVGDLYSTIPLGLYIIRGENVVFLGELDNDELPPRMIQVSADEIRRAQSAEREAMDLKGLKRKPMEFPDCE